jgi:hypothetical protein
MHQSAIIRVHEPADGILAVTVRCCEDPKTDSVLSIHELHRSDSDILKDIEVHKARVEQLHAHKARAKELMASIGVSDPGCGCP